MKEKPVIFEHEGDVILEKKLPYNMPVLTEYGSVSQLTEGGGGTESDGGTQFKPHTMSDRRTKDNIVTIGTHPLGMSLCLFDYKPEYRDAWGHGRQFGVIADEVEKVMSEAVFVGTKGYKMVSYSMLGITRTRH